MVFAAEFSSSVLKLRVLLEPNQVAVYNEGRWEKEDCCSCTFMIGTTNVVTQRGAASSSGELRDRCEDQSTLPCITFSPLLSDWLPAVGSGEGVQFACSFSFKMLYIFHTTFNILLFLGDERKKNLFRKI